MEKSKRTIISSVLCGFFGYGLIKLAEFVSKEEQKYATNPPRLGETPYISIGFAVPIFSVLGWIMIIVAVIYFGLSIRERSGKSDD